MMRPPCKMFKPNKHGSMTVKVMSYRVLRQHILRFGYVRIKRRNESVINISEKQISSVAFRKTTVLPLQRN